MRTSRRNAAVGGDAAAAGGVVEAVGDGGVVVVGGAATVVGSLATVVGSTSVPPDRLGGDPAATSPGSGGFASVVGGVTTTAPRSEDGGIGAPTGPGTAATCGVESIPPLHVPTKTVMLPRSTSGTSTAKAIQPQGMREDEPTATGLLGALAVPGAPVVHEGVAAEPLHAGDGPPEGGGDAGGAVGGVAPDHGALAEPVVYDEAVGAVAEAAGAVDEAAHDALAVGAGEGNDGDGRGVAGAVGPRNPPGGTLGAIIVPACASGPVAFRSRTPSSAARIDAASAKRVAGSRRSAQSTIAASSDETSATDPSGGGGSVAIFTTSPS